MKMCELDREPQIIGKWIADWNQTGTCNYDDMNDVTRVHHPVIQISLRELNRLPLSEMTYRELITRIDPNFLRQAIRARALRGVRLEEFDGDTMVFRVTSSEIEWNGIEYLNLVKFMSWDEIGGDPDLTPREKALMLLWTSDIQLYCEDPSFLYYGFAHILAQLNSAIYPESGLRGRPPVIRNPHHRGICCKHLNRVLRSLPFYNGDIARAITEQWGGRIDQRAINAIRRRADLQAAANEGMDLPPEAEPTPPQEPEIPPQNREEEIPPDLEDENPQNF